MDVNGAIAGTTHTAPLPEVEQGWPRWSPDFLLDEQPRPPPTDVRVEEELAAQAVAVAAGYEPRRVRKFLQRRTVDYSCTYMLSGLERLQQSSVRQDHFLRPSAHFTNNLLAPVYYDSAASSITSTLVHTSTNKVRCPVNVVRWTPEGRRLLTGSQSGEFTLWNGMTFNFETILQAHDTAVRALEWSSTGDWLVSGDQGGMIKYYQLNMNNVQAFQGSENAIRGISFSPDNGRFVTASDDAKLRVWGFEEAREEQSLTGHQWDVKCVEWHPTRGLIVSGSKDNLVKFWDPRSGGNLGTLSSHKQTIQAISWGGPGNDLVVSASRDRLLKVWDIRAMKELYTLRGHQDEVNSVAWHPIHRDLLVSGDASGGMQYWLLSSTNPERPVYSEERAHDSNIWSLAWHPLGHLLASGSNDHTTRFWCRARPQNPLTPVKGADATTGESSQAERSQRDNRRDQGGYQRDGGYQQRDSGYGQRFFRPPNDGSGPSGPSRWGTGANAYGRPRRPEYY